MLGCPVSTDHAHRMRAFNHVLGNTAAATLATTFLWFGITFWAYLETRSVLATSFLGGAYMLGMAIFGVPFGGLVDRFRKHVIMVWSAVGTAMVFVLAGVFYVLTPAATPAAPGRPSVWPFPRLVPVGALLAMIRGLALSTCVTILVDSDRRANANGMVGAIKCRHRHLIASVPPLLARSVSK